MNEARRADIRKVITALSDVRNLLETILGDETDAFNNLSKSLQRGEKGKKMENSTSLIKDTVYDLETLEGHLGEAIE